MCTNDMANVLLGRARSCVSLPLVLSPLVAAWFAQSGLRWGLRWEVPKPSHSGGDLSSAMPRVTCCCKEALAAGQDPAQVSEKPKVLGHRLSPKVCPACALMA